MKRKITDERIIQESHKHNSLGFVLLYFGLLLIIIYRHFGLQQSLSEYWDLATLFFGASIFLSIKRVLSGNYSQKIHHARNFLASLIAAVVFTLTTYLVMDSISFPTLIISAILFFFSFYVITLIFQYLSKRKNDDLLKED